MTAELLDQMPFARAVGVELAAVTPEEVVGTLDWTEDRCTAAGLLHGGAIMTLADSVGAVCAYLNLPEDAGTSTIESKTNFFRGVREGTITATARPLHVGRTTIFVRTEITDGAGKAVAHVTQTQAVLLP